MQTLFLSQIMSCDLSDFTGPSMHYCWSLDADVCIAGRYYGFVLLLGGLWTSLCDLHYSCMGAKGCPLACTVPIISIHKPDLWLLELADVAYVIASLSPNLEVANAALPAYVTSLLFFTGLLNRTADMPSYWVCFCTIFFYLKPYLIFQSLCLL